MLHGPAVAGWANPLKQQLNKQTAEGCAFKSNIDKNIE